MEEKDFGAKVLEDLANVKKSLPSVQGKEDAKTEDTKDKKNKKQKSVDPIVALEEDIHSLLETNKELVNQWRMEQADKINLKRKLENDSINMRKYGGERLAKEILHPLDFLRRVAFTETQNEDVNKYLDGIKMLFNQVDGALSNAGITMIETKPGDEFNENIHEPIEKVKTEAQASGKIVSVVSNGYKLHDRVIVFAKVKVAE